MGAGVSFTGVFPILVTPFDEKENVDLESFVRVVRFMAEIGVDGVTILGVLGESNRMVDSEREELIMAAVAAADGRIPVVVGTGHKGTQATIYLSLMAESLGAAAVMVTPSKEAVPNEERTFEYFRKVAEGITIRKEIYRLRGLLRTNRVRHPGAQLASSAGEQLRSVMARVLPGVDITRPLAL